MPKSEDNGNLSTVVHARLGRLSQEQEALRKAVFRRLAEREAALKKYAVIEAKKLTNFQQRRLRLLTNTHQRRLRLLVKRMIAITSGPS